MYKERSPASSEAHEEIGCEQSNGIVVARWYLFLLLCLWLCLGMEKEVKMEMNVQKPPFYTLFFFFLCVIIIPWLGIKKWCWEFDGLIYENKKSVFGYFYRTFFLKEFL